MSSTSHNQPVHLTPKAGAFFAFAISEQNISFAKSLLAFGAGDSHVIYKGGIGVPTLINIADLKDPNDPQGRSYREVNAEKLHKIPVNTLVELESGARVFVVKHTRDCDQTPLYSLAINPDPEQHKFSMCNGYDEKSLKQITSG